MIPCFVFEIRTVPDIDGLRRLHGLGPELGPAEVAEMAFQRRRQATGSDLLQPHLRRVAAASCVLRDEAGVRVWSAGSPEDAEADLLRHFFAAVEDHGGRPVCWDGKRRALPVLRYRALIHGVRIPRAWGWESGEDGARGNTPEGLLDLSERLAPLGSAEASAGELARLAGFPGDAAREGGRVWEDFLLGRVDLVRNDCEIAVANDYLLFLRCQLTAGVLTPAQYRDECGLLRGYLQRASEPRWRRFLEHWQ